MIKESKDVILYQGVYEKSASTSEAIFLITGMTIGAGILGLPYVISHSGIFIGLILMVAWGLIMLSLNLMLGDIVVRTRSNFQLAGLANKYLGRWAKNIMSVIVIFSGFGVLLAYIIGEGQILSEIFGGSSAFWSVLFWLVGSVFVWRGLQTVKTVGRVLSLTVITLIIVLSIYLFPKMSWDNLTYVNLSNFFLPFSVILFSMHATPSIAEAHALLPGSQKRFKKAIIIGTLIPVCVYIVFCLAIVGYSGLNTPEVATLGLGTALGPKAMVVANAFAGLAMATCFMGIGIALKRTLTWDHKIPELVSKFSIAAIPLILFLFGFRSFVAILDIVGGLFVGLESLFIVLICYVARKKGDLKAKRYGLNNFWLLAIPVIIFFLIATIHSVLKIL